MEHSDSKPGTGRDERVQLLNGQRVEAQEQAGKSSEAKVVVVHESWWPTRQKQGVHVLNPSPAELSYAKIVALLAGTNTVYCYKS